MVVKLETVNWAYKSCDNLYSELYIPACKPFVSRGKN